MGFEKVAIRFRGKSEVLAKYVNTCGTKFAPKMQKTHRLTSIKGLKYMPKSADVVPFVSKLEKNISMFKSDSILQYAAERNPILRKYLDKSEEELLYLIRENKFTEAEKKELRKIFYDAKCYWSEYLIKKEGIYPLRASKEILDKYGEKGNLARARFINVFDEIIFPKSTNPRVIEVENKLADLGIDARLTDHEEIAENIHNAYKNMYNKGIREFPKVRYSLDKEEACEAIANKSLKDRYVIYTDDIFNNIKAEKGYFANPTIEGTIYHEAGHTFNNVGAGSTVIGDTSGYQKVALELKIPEKVSMYSYSLDEFMAEYLSGKFGGKIYTKEIDKFYLENGGYIPPLGF